MHPWVGVSDVRLGVLTEWVTPELVDEVLAECGRGGVKPGGLSPGFKVYITFGLALFAQDSYDDVADNLVGALEGMYETVPNRTSFTSARQRLGPEVLDPLFRRIGGVVAPDGLGGSFWQGMRLAAVGGFVLDSPANRALFGGPTDARKAEARFPQGRVMTLTETGTHASIDARIGTAVNASWRCRWPVRRRRCWSSWTGASPGWSCERHTRAPGRPAVASPANGRVPPDEGTAGREPSGTDEPGRRPASLASRRGDRVNDRVPGRQRRGDQATD
ncbi:transposase domain-containing protein [Streptomyces chartreusis]|uniref:transposase domain-containing protein n=1 Tax=Streptomyces chartreusis TaxID=1969 RepID=UPI0033E7E254